MTILKEQQDYKGQMLVTDKDGNTRQAKSDKYGNITSAIVSQRDEGNRRSLNTIFGDRIEASRFAEISLTFNYGVNTSIFNDKSVNGGSYSIDGNVLKMSTSTAVDGRGILQSKAGLRYRAARDAEAIFTANFTEGVVGSFQRIGLFDDETGFAIGYNEDTFAIMYRRDGVWNYINRSEFNGDTVDGNGKTGFNLNPSAMNIYRIQFGYLGIAPAFFEVYGGSENGWVTMHCFDATNSQAGTHINNPYLPLRFEVTNDGNNTDISLTSGSVYAGVVNDSTRGKPDESSREFGFSNSNVAVDLNTQTVLGIFRSKELFNGVANRILSKLLLLSMTTDGNKSVQIDVVKLQGEPAGSGTWNNLDENSILQYSEDTTVTQGELDNAEILLAVELGKADRFFQELDDLDIKLYPSEYVAITAFSTSGSEVSLALRESERF